MRPLAATIFGIVLFLFIPVVLFLFVAHPAPVAGSLAGGLVLMAGHRFLARPYMLAARPYKCVWCNRVFAERVDEQPDAARAPQRAVELAQGGSLPPLELLTCAAHVAPTQRFFAFVDRCRLPLRIGIGLPLGLLLGALVALAAGLGDWTEGATALFQLAVGLTVHLAALGPWLGALQPQSRAAFPVHNFYLLGIRAILWIFRLVGIWWIVVGGSYWLKAAGLLP
jgi:hypothetical protein